MAKRKGVTLDNAQRVYHYFRDVIGDYARRDKLGLSYEAEVEFEAIPEIKYCDVKRYHKALKIAMESSQNTDMVGWAKQGETSRDPFELDAWVLKHVSPRGWQQCLTNLRQSRHATHSKGRKTQVKINSSVYFDLKRLAEEKELTIDECLVELIKKERGF